MKSARPALMKLISLGASQYGVASADCTKSTGAGMSLESAAEKNSSTHHPRFLHDRKHVRAFLFVALSIRSACAQAGATIKRKSHLSTYADIDMTAFLPFVSSTLKRGTSVHETIFSSDSFLHDPIGGVVSHSLVRARLRKAARGERRF